MWPPVRQSSGTFVVRSVAFLRFVSAAWRPAFFPFRFCRCRFKFLCPFVAFAFFPCVVSLPVCLVALFVAVLLPCSVAVSLLVYSSCDLVAAFSAHPCSRRHQTNKQQQLRACMMHEACEESNASMIHNILALFEHPAGGSSKQYPQHTALLFKK